MQKKNKWIMYGATGVIGFGLLAGGAATVANAMELETSSSTVAGGIISGKEVTAQPKATSTNEDGKVTVVSIPSADSIDSTPSINSAPSTPSPNSVISTPSVQSVDSPNSAPSPVSVPSVDSPQSVDSVESADSN